MIARYMKLYPYALLCLTVLGAWTNISWEMTAHKRSAQVTKPHLMCNLLQIPKN